jgi:hypothetical protein
LAWPLAIYFLTACIAFIASTGVLVLLDTTHYNTVAFWRKTFYASRKIEELGEVADITSP